ncbi:MAG: elongation factor 1-beta [Candidatus Helarchaeota archaeon]
MGDKRLLAIMKVLPESTEVDLDKLKDKIADALPDKFELIKETFKKEYVAFGLEALQFRVFCPNYEGITDELEELLGKIPDVQRAELIMMSLTKL